MAAFVAFAAAPSARAADGRVAFDTIVSAREMLSRLNQPWVQLIDVRSAGEHAGVDIRALRGGHIPGAINVPVAGRGAAAQPAPLLASRLEALDPHKETIVYGHDAADAAALATTLAQRGFRQVRIYAPGWAAWANTLELPVADQQFADVGAMHERLAELQRTVDRLSARTGAASPSPVAASR